MAEAYRTLPLVPDGSPAGREYPMPVRKDRNRPRGRAWNRRGGRSIISPSVSASHSATSTHHPDRPQPARRGRALMAGVDHVALTGNPPPDGLVNPSLSTSTRAGAHTWRSDPLVGRRVGGYAIAVGLARVAWASSMKPSTSASRSNAPPSRCCTRSSLPTKSAAALLHGSQTISMAQHSSIVNLRLQGRSTTAPPTS